MCMSIGFATHSGRPPPANDELTLLYLFSRTQVELTVSNEEMSVLISGLTRMALL